MPPLTVDQAWTWFCRNWRLRDNYIAFLVDNDLAGPSSWRTCCSDEAPCEPCRALITRRDDHNERFSHLIDYRSTFASWMVRPGRRRKQ